MITKRSIPPRLLAMFAEKLPPIRDVMLFPFPLPLLPPEPPTLYAISAAWRQPAGKRPLPTPQQCPNNATASAHLRCETSPGASAQPLVPNAISAAWRQPAGKRPLPTPCHRPPQRAHLRCETSPGAPAQPLVPNTISAAWRQPAGKRPLPTPQQRPNTALPSARTFGAKHRRGLPPSRWFQTQSQPHGGSLRANGPCKRPHQRAHLRCETSPGASAQPLIKRNPSRMAAACGQMALPPPHQRPRQHAHLRCQTSPGAAAQPLAILPEAEGWYDRGQA